jgi:hypothetical protein
MITGISLIRPRKRFNAKEQREPRSKVFSLLFSSNSACPPRISAFLKKQKTPSEDRAFCGCTVALALIQRRQCYGAFRKTITIHMHHLLFAIGWRAAVAANQSNDGLHYGTWADGCQQSEA